MMTTCHTNRAPHHVRGSAIIWDIIPVQRVTSCDPTENHIISEEVILYLAYYSCVMSDIISCPTTANYTVSIGIGIYYGILSA
jgi:hypothetical protein